MIGQTFSAGAPLESGTRGNEMIEADGEKED